MVVTIPGFFISYEEIPLELTYEIKSPPGGMRPDAYGIVTAYGGPHLARKAEQVPQGLRDTGSLKRTCTLCRSREYFWTFH